MSQANGNGACLMPYFEAWNVWHIADHNCEFLESTLRVFDSQATYSTAVKIFEALGSEMKNEKPKKSAPLFTLILITFPPKPAH